MLHFLSFSIQIFHSLGFSSVKDSEKTMETHSSTLAWKNPWMEEPGRLQSKGLLGVGYN